jgi:hypothetical protein
MEHAGCGVSSLGRHCRHRHSWSAHAYASGIPLRTRAHLRTTCDASQSRWCGTLGVELGIGRSSQGLAPPAADVVCGRPAQIAQSPQAYPAVRLVVRGFQMRSSGGAPRPRPGLRQLLAWAEERPTRRISAVQEAGPLPGAVPADRCDPGRAWRRCASSHRSSGNQGGDRQVQRSHPVRHLPSRGRPLVRGYQRRSRTARSDSCGRAGSRSRPRRRRVRSLFRCQQNRWPASAIPQPTEAEAAQSGGKPQAVRLHQPPQVGVGPGAAAPLHRNQRLDALHKATTALAKTKSVIVVEDLHVAGMVRNRHLARVISDQGWAQFIGNWPTSASGMGRGYWLRRASIRRRRPAPAAG